jgi:hypothetical protein
MFMQPIGFKYFPRMENNDPGPERLTFVARWVESRRPSIQRERFRLKEEYTRVKGLWFDLKRALIFEVYLFRF